MNVTSQPLIIPDKTYFKIGEVSRLVGVKPYILRYWESEFRPLKPDKSRSKHRLYRRRDVEVLLQIKHLLYDQKFTIAGAKKRIASQIKEGSFTPGSSDLVITESELKSKAEASGSSSASLAHSEDHEALSEELAKLTHTLSQITDERDRLLSDRDSTLHQLNQARARLAELSAEREKLISSQRTHSDTSLQLQRSLEASQEARDDAESKSKTLQERVDALEESRRLLFVEKERLDQLLDTKPGRESIEDLERERDQLLEERARLVAEVEITRERLRERLRERKEKESGLAQEVNTLREERQQLEAKLSEDQDLKPRLDALQRQVDEERRRATKAEKAASEQDEKATRHAETLNALRETHEALQITQREQARALEESQRELQSLQDELEAQKTSLESLAQTQALLHAVRKEKAALEDTLIEERRQHDELARRLKAQLEDLMRTFLKI